MAFRVLSMIPPLTISYLFCLFIISIWAQALVDATRIFCVQKRRLTTLGGFFAEFPEVVVGLLMDIVVLTGHVFEKRTEKSM
jgi:hypothetical protein